MGHRYAEIAWTPAVKRLQLLNGSRDSYAAMESGADYNHHLTGREGAFIAERDSFYMASVTETGWPYLQHRGGPVGFMKVLDERTIGFADYAGNRQYISAGNFSSDDRVSLFFMDYPNRRRLKLFGRVVIVGAAERDVLAPLEDPRYPAQVERAFLIRVEGYDWNCPQHITPRYSPEQWSARQQTAAVSAKPPVPAGQPATADPGDQQAGAVLGSGPLHLYVSGMRQLTPRVRAYELRAGQGGELPRVAAGSHLRLPIRLPGGELTERHYSIASNPARRDVYEIAVQRDEQGNGGSRALHATYALGQELRVDPPENHFALHGDGRPAVLIAGGIGITPIKAMAQSLAAGGARFELHYAGRSLADMAFSDRLRRQFGERLKVYSRADGQRLDLDAVLAALPDKALVYACGPDRLIAGLMDAAGKQGIARDRIRVERFA